MFGYKVEINAYCDCDESPEEGYGEWYSSYSNSIGKVKESSSCPDVVSVEKISEGEIAFVVWAEWSSGDSYGNSTRGSTEPLAIFKYKKDAEGLKAACEKETSSNTNGYSFVASTGQKFTSKYPPWVGYFEGLDAIHIEEVLISGDGE